MISVVIPLYNKEKYVRRTIDSVLKQTFQDFEIVVVNDGSTDNGVGVVNSYNNPKIRLVNQENQGVSAARNRGISEAKYDYIAFLDADDEWTESHLSDIKKLIDKFPHCGVFGTSYQIKKGDELFTPRVYGSYTFSSNEGVLDNYYELASGADFPIHQSSCVVKKNRLIKNWRIPRWSYIGGRYHYLGKTVLSV